MLDSLKVPIFIFSVALSIAILVPLTGVLVRYRANYNPKGLQLDPEGGAQPYTGPIIRSYFTMMGRVYRIEGIQGLYKGLMPTVFSTFVMASFVLVFLDAPKTTHHPYKAPDAGILGTLMYSILLMLMSLPTAILTYRAITTPYRLSYYNIVQSFRVLLTPTERRRPWTIYLTPGLLAAQVLHISIVVLGLGSLRRVLLPTIQASTVNVVIYVVLVALATMFLTPLEVIATRLAIQRNHASAEYNSVSQEIEGDTDNVPEYGNEEDVIGLRSEGDPYLGLIDCAKRIVDEEGWSTLYRAWWLTVLGGLVTMF
ncbi:Mitochondrial carrier domain containing protein [Amanita muscaria]